MTSIDDDAYLSVILPTMKMMKMKPRVVTALLVIGLVMGFAGFIVYAQSDTGRATPEGDWLTRRLPFLPTSTPSWVIHMVDQPTTVQAERAAGEQVYLPAYLPRNMALKDIARLVPDRENGSAQPHTLRLAFLGVPSADRLNLNQFAVFQEEIPSYLQNADGPLPFDPKLIVSKTVIGGHPAVYVRSQFEIQNDARPESSMHMFYFRIGNHRFTMFGDIGFAQMVKVAESLSPTLAEVQRGTGDVPPTPVPYPIP